MMERLNPFCKAMTILIAGVLLSFSYSVALNLLLFGISLFLILFFSKAEKKRILPFLVPAGIAAGSLFMTGFLHASDAAAQKAETVVHANVNFAAMTNNAVSLYNAMQISTRVLGFVGLGLLFALTTKGQDFIISLMHQAKVKPKFAYGILAAYHLIPAIGREIDDARLASRVRGVRTGFLGMKPFFAAMVNCVRWSENVAMAMESKGFDGEGARTYYRKTEVRFCDYLFGVLVIGGVIAGMIFLHF